MINTAAFMQGYLEKKAYIGPGTGALMGGLLGGAAGGSLPFIGGAEEPWKRALFGTLAGGGLGAGLGALGGALSEHSELDELHKSMMTAGDPSGEDIYATAPDVANEIMRRQDLSPAQKIVLMQEAQRKYKEMEPYWQPAHFFNPYVPTIG